MTPRPSSTRYVTRLAGALAVVVSLCLYGIGFGAPSAGAQTSSFTFTGGGWGHGIGMSQWGAKGLADNGSPYDNILRWYYRDAAVGRAPVSNDLQVLIAQQAASFTLTANVATGIPGLGTLGAGQTVVATPGTGVISWTGALSGPTGAVDIAMPAGGVTVSPPGYTYQYGNLRVSLDGGGGLRGVIRDLPMQQYLYGLGEMPSSWNVEALKAQATAARTYAQKKRDGRGSSDFDLHGSVLDQSYTGTKFETQAWHTAVDSTGDGAGGQVVTYQGTLIDAVYSASSGGHTENSEYVWIATVPYLKGVPDPFDAGVGNPNGAWSRTYSGDELGSWFGVGTVTSVQVLGPLGVSGRVDRSTIRLTGTSGTRDVLGAAFRSTVNAQMPTARELMSTKFTVAGGVTPPPAPPAPAPPANTLATGAFTIARSDGRTIIVGGDSTDPNGYPLVRVVSTMGSERAVRDYRSTNGMFLLTWTGSPGTRNVCVTVYDEPSGQAVSLGCRDIVVK